MPAYGDWDIPPHDATPFQPGTSGPKLRPSTSQVTPVLSTRPFVYYKIRPHIDTHQICTRPALRAQKLVNRDLRFIPYTSACSSGDMLLFLVRRSLRTGECAAFIGCYDIGPCGGKSASKNRWCEYLWRGRRGSGFVEGWPSISTLAKREGLWDHL